MFIDSVLFARADTTTSSASSLTTSVSTSNSTPTSTTVTSSGSSSSSSSPSSSASSSTASTSASSSSSSSSSTQSTSITSSASSTSATASATSSRSSSSSDGKEIGAIVGGVIGGLVVLTLLSVVFTALRRKRRNAKKRPRGSVYLGNMDQNQLDTFLKQKPRTNVDSLHSSSSMPLLSLPQVDTTLQHDIATEYTDVPAPNSYRDYQPNAAQGNDQNGTGGESESGHSLFLPSPYSQHGHDGNDDDVPPELPQPRLMTPSLRPESQFYEPIPVQVGDFSIKALEESASGSRSSTPVSLSMMHGKNGVNITSSPPVHEENASL
ncbi:hypothetical protein GGU11DRAFT_742809 [Lentinula aff. detonsa]|nr:hypothetical protein GGU11DRAFT_742809 [Lentinula aff. detonsa]